MSGNGELRNIPSFPPEYRASGLLLHVTSLPSPYGIGDLGPSAFSWVDRLHDAGQRWWQALPLGPTGYGNSPYQPLSSFAGNVLVISPGALISDGLLQASDCECHFTADRVDYDAVIPFKQRLLEKAWTNFKAGEREDLRPAYDEFCAKHANWLEDYALFAALKEKYHGAYYLEWPPELVQRHADTMVEARRELATQIDQVRFAQFLVFRQGDQLKNYAHAKGVSLIGDLPFFVSPDSSDVWANPEFFLLDEQRRPRFIAGVPPDYFSATGQLWGNPVYNWDVLRSTGYRWCIDRFQALLAHVDRQWYEELPDYQRQNLWNYLKRSLGESVEAAPALMRLAWSSVAALTISPLQDVLNLGREARMNVPGRASGNWSWRVAEDMLSPASFESLRELTASSRRSDPFVTRKSKS